MLEFFAVRGVATFSTPTITLQNGERLSFRSWVKQHIKLEGRKEFLEAAVASIPFDFRPTIHYSEPFITRLMICLRFAQEYALKSNPSSNNIALLTSSDLTRNLVVHWDLDQKRIISGRINGLKTIQIPVCIGKVAETGHGKWIVGEAE